MIKARIKTLEGSSWFG